MEKTNSSSKIYSAFSSFIKSSDIFGKPISLNLNGEETFNTFFGGMISLILKFSFAIYGWFLLKTVIYREEVNTSTDIQYWDHQADSNIVDASQFGLVIGFRFFSISPKFSPDIIFDEDYFDLKYYGVNAKQSKDSVVGFKHEFEELEIENCTNQYDGILTPEQIEAFQIDKYKCPKTDEYLLGGSELSEEYSYISLILSRCQGLGWKPKNEIDEAIEALEVIFAPLSYYFNSQKHNDPVSLTNSDNAYFALLSQFTQVVQYDLQFNEAISYDSVWTDQIQKVYQYISTGGVSNILQNAVDERVIELNVRQDAKYIKIERRYYSLLDLFGQLGGMAAIFFPLGAFISRILSNKVYWATLLSLFYHTEKSTDKIIPTNNTMVRVGRAEVLTKVSLSINIDNWRK